MTRAGAAKERRSLAGVRVVVTRRAEQSRRLAEVLRRRGAIPVLCPTIRVAPPLTWTPVDDAARRMSEGAFEWVLFTSANAVEHFLGRAGSSVPEPTKIAAVGPGTADALSERGVEVDLVPEEPTAEGLGRSVGSGRGEVLLPRAEDVPPLLVDLLVASGWTPVPVTVYRTIAADPSGPGAAHVRRGDYDAVTFTSASTARGFVSAFGVPDVLMPGAPEDERRAVACIGPVTAAACAEAGVRVDAVAEEPSNEALAEALECIFST